MKPSPEPSSDAKVTLPPRSVRSELVQPLQEWRASLAALPRSVWILCFGAFVNRFGAFVIPFLALYMNRQGFNLAQTSAAVTAYGAGHLVASLLGGYLSDRIGRRKTIAFSMGSAALAMLLLSQAHSAGAIISLAWVVGLTAEFYRPACSALLADLVPAGQRVSAFAAYRLAVNAGWAFGPATAGFVAERSFFWLFVGDAITSLLFGLLAWFALPHGIRGNRADSRWAVALRHARHDHKLWQTLAASLAVGLVFFQMSSTFGLHVTSLGYSSVTYGLLISLNGVMIVLLELPLTAFTQRWNPRRVMAVGYFLIGSGFALNALGWTMPCLVAAILLFTLGEMLAMPVAAAYMADLAPEPLRGRYMGLFSLTMSVALVTGPGIGLIAFEHAPRLLWITCGLLGATGAWIISRHATEKKMAE